MKICWFFSANLHFRAFKQTFVHIIIIIAAALVIFPEKKNGI